MGSVHRKKPRGRDETLGIGPSGEVVFIGIDLPATKEGIEWKYAESFVKNTKLPFSCIELSINETDDFDLTIETDDGRVFLELMEIAPLSEGVTHATAPNTNNSYEMAEFVLGKIQTKSRKYTSKCQPRIGLLLYSTDFKFSLSSTAIALLQYWLQATAHCFEFVYIHDLHPNLPPTASNQNQVVTGKSQIVFPSPSDYWLGFDPSQYRESTCIHLDVREFKPMPVGWFPTPLFPSRNRGCECGSGLRFKHCHGNAAGK